MWPLPTIRDQYIHIVLSTTSIDIYWIEGIKPCYIKAHQHHNMPTLITDCIYNLTYIKQYIIDFVQQHKLTHAYGNYVLTEDLVQEQIITHHKSHPLLQDLIPKKTLHMHYIHTYLGPRMQHHTHYVCAIAAPIIFQLTILHKQVPLYMLHIQSSLTAQIALYNLLHAQDARKTYLMHALNQDILEIPELFSDNSINSMCSNATYPTSTDIHANTTMHKKSLVYALASHAGVYS